MMEQDDYVYRFEYADGSAFQIYEDGRAFITFPEKDGHRRPPEQKLGKIDSRIRLLKGSAAKPRQDEIERLRNELEEWKRAAGVEAGLRREFLARAERLRLELEKIGWMDEFLDAQGAKWMMEIAREAVQADEDSTLSPSHSEST